MNCFNVISKNFDVLHESNVILLPDFNTPVSVNDFTDKYVVPLDNFKSFLSFQQSSNVVNHHGRLMASISLNLENELLKSALPLVVKICFI